MRNYILKRNKLSKMASIELNAHLDLQNFESLNQLISVIKLFNLKHYSGEVVIDIFYKNEFLNKLKSLNSNVKYDCFDRKKYCSITFCLASETIDELIKLIVQYGLTLEIIDVFVKDVNRKLIDELHKKNKYTVCLIINDNDGSHISFCTNNYDYTEIKSKIYSIFNY